MGNQRKDAMVRRRKGSRRCTGVLTAALGIVLPCPECRVRNSQHRHHARRRTRDVRNHHRVVDSVSRLKVGERQGGTGGARQSRAIELH